MLSRGRGRRAFSPKQKGVVKGLPDLVDEIRAMSELSLEEKGASASSSKLGENEYALVKRPNIGQIGMPIPLKANYVRMRINGDHCLYQYSVRIEKQSKQIFNSDTCRRIFWEVMSDNAELIGKTYYGIVYDDSAMLITNRPLNMNGRTSIELCHSGSKRQPRAGASSSPQIKLTITPLPCCELHLSYNETDERSRMTMQFLDALITQRVRCPFEEISKDFYPFKQSIYLLPRADRREWSHDIGAGIEAWTGVYSAVKVCRKGLMLNADVSTKVFYKLDMPVMDYYLSIINDVKRGQVMNRRNIAMDERQRRTLDAALKGLSLKFTYSDIYMKYVGIGRPANVQRFTMNGQNGEAFELTVEEYFRRYKDIELRYPDLPVIQCGSSSRHIYIPMELVNLSDKVQRVTKMLNEFQLPKLIRVCGIDPKERFKQIDYMLNGLDQSRMDNFLHSFDVELDNRFVELNGRVLPSPHLELHNGFRIAVRDGVWPLENQVKEAPVRVIFGVICVDRAIEYQQFRPCFKTFMSACELFGMQFADGFETVEGIPLYEWDSSAIRSNPLLPKVIEFKTSLFEHERSHHVKIKPMLIFIVPRENPLVYGHVKVVCDLKEGIASQVLLSKTLTKMSGNPERCAVAHNVFLKVNAKLDGVNNGVCRESLEWSKFTNKNEATLFIGVDVTHPAPTDKQSPSIAAVVSSIDVTATRYSCSFKLQHCRNDRIIQMVDPLKERLIDFYRKSGLTPAHIVIFRDGVSNSEFLGTMNEELTNLKVAMNQLDPRYNPTVSYVVIQKRHHTRFYVEGKQYARCKSNVPPGTVVDDDITSPNIFDFYLCSHLGAIGTSRPAHYTVLYDSWNLSADQWQQMAYALCHLYTRCARSVSIPAPIYYAHLACKRARFYVNETLSSSKTGSSLESKEGERIATELNEKIRVHDNTPGMYYV